MANQLVPSSSFTTTPSWTYDVFLSFRGEDTRYNFTDHLYQALVRHGIHTFIDHSELPIGEKIAPTLLEAIENSRISVIIFSENYASSRWCLDELVHILECRKSKGQMTRSIFYKVDPSDVRHQRNSYDAAFADHSLKYENNLEKVQGWRTALTEAADLKGATLNKGEYEAAFINNFIAEISTELLNRTYLHVASYPVGIESCVKMVEMLLGVGGNDRRVVGIWGTSGIGKTAIARAVYNASAHKFDGSCFLANVRETLTLNDGVIKLQNTLLSKILCGKKWKIVDVHQGINLIKNRLRQKKILLILDDVDKLGQLKDWVDVDCFGEGSRVIITTKDRKLLNFYGGQWIYEVQKLEDDKALELFSWNAFKRNRPPDDDYLRLAQRAIDHAQGLPLALNLMGSYLRNESIGRWQDVLNSYDSYGGEPYTEPYTDIQIILRKTYDAWDCNLQKVFLDIACFFKGENKDYVLQILRSSTLKVRQDCIEVLVEKAIITIEYNRILMHDLLEKMGKHIVYEESSTEPGKRSRLWHHEDVRDVLIDCKGTEKIRGIVVNLPKPDEIPLNPKSFLKMVNLEFFINYNAHFSGRVDYLSNSLRLIEFGGRLNIDQKHTYVLNLRSNFHPRHLVKFDVSYSGIRQLKEFKNLAKLTWMNLSGCEFLEKIPDLSGSPNIRKLDLRGCTSLVEVHDSVGCLDKLEVLYLTGCSKLTGFAKRLGLRSLRFLNLNGCRSLKSFPEIEGKMESLRYLDMEESGIRELPSIAYFTNLERLNASGSELQNIQLLPFGKKVKFDEVSSCSTDVHLYLDLSGCNLSESDFLVPLVCWSALEELDLSRNNFVSLPDCISKVVNLELLCLWDCKRLREIPVLPPKLEELHLPDCTSLEKIPKLPPRLQFLNLYNCSGLSGDEVAKFENNLLNEEIRPCYDFRTIYPGNEVPKWCSYTSNHPTTFQPLPEYESDEDDWDKTFAGGNEFRFEFPLKLQVGEMLVGLALCFVVEPSTKLDCGIYPSIIINGKKLLRYDIRPWHGPLMNEVNLWYDEDIWATHVRLALMSLWDFALKPGVHICQFVFRFQNGCPVKSCGVHCLLRPTSSLGMRPHPRGSSDIVDDEYDQELQWIKLVSGIEEDEEQEQPSD
ncbi:disease resistance protein RUN1 [Pyrus x bretschneideri]|uniref:disease resistance protein RUN1 n=1 Tax=Pyrus x bretschneideri TaxID=225117 RepID=UPI00202E3380|nr:disease resistance protein RUN1 [Pyrus x bretschneideri]